MGPLQHRAVAARGAAVEQLGRVARVRSYAACYAAIREHLGRRITLTHYGRRHSQAR